MRRKYKKMPDIKCLVCGKRQGSQICKKHRIIIKKMIDMGIDPEEIVRIVAPYRQASLLEWVYNER